MNQTLSKINTSDFLGFLEDIFNITNIQKVEAIHKDKLESSTINGFDFNNIALFGTSSNFGEFLEAKTGHKNLVFSFVKMTQAKEAKKQDLYKATTAINRTIPSYNIIFFYNQTHLHIAFAKRRLHKNRIIKEDVLDKISIIKDINLKKPSQAHLKNLKSLKEVVSHQEINVYYDKILESLSVENLNKAFYRDILECFKDFVDSMDLPNKTDDAKRDFTLRLISRILFCKFLEKKGLIDEKIWKIESDKYYHNVLEPLFFGTLNTPKQNRKYDLIPENIVSLLKEIPYLNGGLFNPQNDYYNTDNPLANISNLTVPNEPINKLFRTLDKYHFTIDEGSLKYEEIALDPELLGRIFESLLSELFTDNKIEKLDKQSLRKATGSFYTPREIVSYMVKESLKLYLQNSTDIKAQTLEKLFLDDCNEDFTQHKEVILEALKKIKILDPACGSGAFPMGILNAMLEIYEKLKDERKAYEIKKEILQNCIYGIDIQSMAIEISRLRAFLSLIIDEDNDKIEPLPNLDFKFISANSLAKLKVSLQDSAGERRLGSDIYERCLGELKKIREETFKSNCDKKSLQELYKKQIATLKNEVIFNENTDAIDALVDYNPFDSQSVAKFFDSEIQFGIKEFDIVIGNPPYIKEADNKKAFENTKNLRTYQGKMDIWYHFVGKGFDVLKNHGILTFIATNNWITSSGAKKLRNVILTESKILNLVDFGAYMIFDSTSIQTMIMQFKKINSTPKSYKINYSKIEAQIPTIKHRDALLNNQTFDNNLYLTPTITPSKNNYKPLTFVDTDKDLVLNKIFENGQFYLNNYEIQIGIGLTDKVKNKMKLKNHKVGEGIFQLSNEELKNLNLNKNEKKLIKPLYTTSELYKFFGNSQNNEWVIYTDSSFKNPNSMDKYPNLKKHLDKFKSVITSDNKPYGLHRAKQEKFFNKTPSIVSLRKCPKYPIFTYVDFDCYVTSTFFILQTNRIDMKYLIGILNSKLVAFWLKHKGKMQGNNYQVDKEPLLSIPIVQINSKNKKIADEIINNVDKILTLKSKNADTSEFEARIDNLVYKLYNLTNDEIKIIEGK